MKAIVNGKIIINNSIMDNKILLFNNKIIGFVDEIPLNCEVIDAKGLYISPGLIDVHIHGSYGADVMDKDLEAIKTISEGIVEKGVTSFLPTTMTMEKENIYQALNNIRYWMNNEINGAKVLGAHLEGPFINEKFKGAQNSDYILEPNYNFISDYIDVIRIITYAPELDINFKFTKEVKEKTNITLSIGHTGASFNQAKDAFAHGCSHVTHLFNGMTPLNHREPGTVGAALTSDVYSEVIADNIHISPQIYQFIVDNKGCNKLILITDSMRGGCMLDGLYDLGGQQVIIKEGSARLNNGVLAGSVLTLNQGVKNFYDNTNVDITNVIDMASLNPARSIGVDNIKGSLDVGKDADIALFDEDLNCYLTICQGKIVFNRI